MTQAARDSITGELIELSVQAGETIMEVFRAGFDVQIKDDSSPVTIADQRAEAVILKGLQDLLPDIPVVAEESAAAGNIPDVGDGPFFLVDPLDGTKEFIHRRDAFTVNIALIENGVPVLGVVFAPALGRLYYGYLSEHDEPDVAAIIEDALAGNRTPSPIKTRTANPARLAIVASKSHSNPETEAYLANYPDAELVTIGSSLKFCLVAEGQADLYPRLGPTMEWDTAAGQAVLMAAGGDVLAPDGEPFMYNKPDFRNGFFLVLGDRSFQPASIQS